MEKSIIIIGGGLTGLAAGCYGRMNGYRTKVFEMHEIAGGVCTGWKRKGYIIDGAMNWLIGTKPGTDYNRIWQELGAAQKWKVYNHNNYINLDGADGNLITVPVDPDLLQQKLIEIAPEDEVEIRKFCRAAKKAGRIEMPVDKPRELYNLLDALKAVKMLPFLNFMRKWTRVTASEYGARFKNPVLRLLFNMGSEDSLSDMPAVTMPMLFGWLGSGEGGYIIGGALALAGYIEQRYRELGGELHMRSRVDRILVENDSATGIRLADGTEHRADWVISAADGYATIFEMLGGKYIDEKISRFYKEQPLFEPLVYAAFGVNREFDEIPAALNGLYLRFEKPVTIAGRVEKACQLLIYKYDPTLSETGKTVLIAELSTDYDYWEKLSGDREAYKAEKERISDAIAAELEKRFPGFISKIEMRDLATPVTWVRYTGNWRGSYEGWMMTKESMMKSMQKTLPGLAGFYMAGQWVNPGGGMPTAAMSGNHTVQLICSNDGKKFVTALPGQ